MMPLEECGDIILGIVKEDLNPVTSMSDNFNKKELVKKFL